MIKLFFDNKFIYIENIYFADNGDFIVALRPFIEALKGEIKQLEVSIGFKVMLFNNIIDVKLGDPTILINGVPFTLTVEPQLIGDIFCIPILSFFEAIGFSVRTMENSNNYMVLTKKN